MIGKKHKDFICQRNISNKANCELPKKIGRSMFEHVLRGQNF
jgi:hypothetical protein